MILFLLLLPSFFSFSCSGTGQNFDSDCECGPGTFKTNSHDVPTCQECDFGTFSETSTQKYSTGCSECPEGLCSYSKGATTCTKCNDLIFTRRDVQATTCSGADSDPLCTCGPWYSKEVDTSN